MSVNWDEAKNKYVFGNRTYQQIADEFGVSLRSVERKASKGQWVRARSEHVAEVTEECRRRSIKLGAECLEELNADMQELEQNFRKTVKPDPEKLMAPRDLQHLSSALLNMLSYRERVDKDEDDDRETVIRFVGLDDEGTDTTEADGETEAVPE